MPKRVKTGINDVKTLYPELILSMSVIFMG